MKKIVFNLSTGETKAEYIARCGTDTCRTCGKAVPKNWGTPGGPNGWECVRCEEMRAEARREEEAV